MISRYAIETLKVLVILSAGMFASPAVAGKGDSFDWPNQSPMTFRKATTGGNCGSCIWVAAEGTITADTPGLFREFISKDFTGAGPVYVRFNSDGGNILAGMKLGELIRSNGFNTAVGKTVGVEGDSGIIWTKSEAPNGECASACVFAFAGGVQRHAVSTNGIGFTKSGQLGVHQFYDPRALAGMDQKLFSGLDRSDDQLIVALILEHLIRLGISSELAAIASSTRWQNVRWLTDQELRRTKLDNVSIEATARLVGYRNGVATAVVEFSRADASYAVEFYCDTAKQMLLKARISSRNVVEPDVVKDWSLYDNLSLGDGIKLKKVRMKILDRPAGGSDVDIVFRFTGADAKSIAKVKEFQFEDWSSRWANEAARELSFGLPIEFEGLHVLPRNCTRDPLN